MSETPSPLQFPNPGIEIGVNHGVFTAAQLRLVPVRRLYLLTVRAGLVVFPLVQQQFDGVQMAGNVMPHPPNCLILVREGGVMLFLSCNLRRQQGVLRAERTALRHAPDHGEERRIRRNANRHGR